MSPETDRRVVSLVISSSDSMKRGKPTEVRVDETLAENIMTLAMANEHGLLVEEMEGLERVEFGDQGSGKVLGVAKAYWWPSGCISRERRKTQVLFWVCERLPEKLDIILGRPFHEREAQEPRRNRVL